MAVSGFRPDERVKALFGGLVPKPADDNYICPDVKLQIYPYSVRYVIFYRKQVSICT